VSKHKDNSVWWQAEQGLSTEVSDEAWKEIKLLKISGIPLDQIAKKYNLDLDFLNKKILEDFSPRDQLEETLNNSIMEMTALISDEKKKAGNKKNDFIQSVLKDRVELARELYKLKRASEFWSVEKIRNAVGKFRCEEKAGQVVECLIAMGMDGKTYEEMKDTFDRTTYDALERAVDGSPTVVKNTMYFVKTLGWEKLKERYGISRKASVVDNSQKVLGEPK